MQDTTSGKNNNTASFGERAGINDEKVLGEIYAANYPAIEKYILANSGTRDDARDIYQEAFIAFWRNVQLNKFEPHHGNAVSSYLMRIAKYKWIDVLRRNNKTIAAEVSADHADRTDIFLLEQEDEQYLSQVKTQYKKMGEPCRELLYRFYFRKEMLKQIAAHFSWTEATAKNNKYRCLHKLRNLVLNK